MQRMPGVPRGARQFLTDEEKESAPQITGSLLKRIFGYLKPYKFQLLMVMVAILASATFGLLPSILTGRIVDEALINKDLSLLIKLIIAAFFTLLASQIIGVLESYINSWISQHIIYDMKNEMFGHLQRMPHAFFTTEPQGDIITRMNSDIDGVSSVVSGTLTSILSNIAVVVTSLIALFSMSWKLAIVGIVVIPLLIIPTRSVGRTRWKLLSESQEAHDKLNEVVTESLSVSGSLLVKLFTREKIEMQQFSEVNGEVMKYGIKEQRSGKFFHVIMGMFTDVGPLLIYFAGGYLIISKGDPTLTVGMITATVALINRLYRPVQSLLNIQVDVTRSMALFTRIFDYLDRDETIKNKKNAVKPSLENAKISFEHVDFAYEADQPILQDLSFTVPGGQMFAIVGPSGSGKSTAVNLIPRLYDADAGCVKLNGVDVRDIDLEHLRRNIGVVTQETYLFNGTIRDNLLMAKPGATDEELQSACKTAKIHDFIMGLPEGYNTVVGNRGLKLSGGEKQRVSIARVILKDPKILILDEATSALDSILENQIQDELKVIMEGRTSICIAHRLSTILAADQILVLDHGHVEEQGPHAELLEQDGLYRELYETQFVKALEAVQAAERKDDDDEAEG